MIFGKIKNSLIFICLLPVFGFLFLLIPTHSFAASSCGTASDTTYDNGKYSFTLTWDSKSKTFDNLDSISSNMPGGTVSASHITAGEYYCCTITGSKTRSASCTKKTAPTTGSTSSNPYKNSLLGQLFPDPFHIFIAPKVDCKTSPNDPSCKNNAFSVIAKRVTDILIGVLAALFVLMFIIGGIQYITSAGNEERAKAGKKTLTYAVGGLILSVVAGTLANTIVYLSGQASKQSTIAGAIGTVTSYLLGGLALLAVLFIIIGGLQYITSRGNAQQTDRAKKTLSYSVGGLIAAILSYFIYFLISKTITGFLPSGGQAVNNLTVTITKIVDFLLGFSALVAVLFIIYAGILYVTSSGNEERIKVAKKTLANSIIGLVIIVLSFFIVNIIVALIT